MQTHFACSIYQAEPIITVDSKAEPIEINHKEPRNILRSSSPRNNCTATGHNHKEETEKNLFKCFQELISIDSITYF